MDVIEWVNDRWGIDPEIQLKLFYSVLTMFILVAVRQLLMKAIFWRVKEVRQRYNWKNSVRYTFIILGIIIISAIWVDEISSFATFFGLISAGLAVALKDPIVNLAGWLFILFRRPFEVGDRVEVDGHAGDVIDIRAFQFTLNEIGNWVDSDQSTGRIIHVPNGKVFTKAQYNYQQGFSHIWNEVPVIVTFESDWEKAKEILTNIVGAHAENFSKSAKNRLLEASKKFLIFYNTLSPVVYTTVKDSGVVLTMRYLCLPKKRRGTEHAIWEDVLKEFRKHNDIDFAYPTQRIYYNPKERKEGSRLGPPPASME